MAAEETAAAAATAASAATSAPAATAATTVATAVDAVAAVATSELEVALGELNLSEDADAQMNENTNDLLPDLDENDEDGPGFSCTCRATGPPSFYGHGEPSRSSSIMDELD